MINLDASCAVSKSREVVSMRTKAIIGTVAIGAIIGLALFATLTGRHDSLGLLSAENVKYVMGGFILLTALTVIVSVKIRWAEPQTKSVSSEGLKEESLSEKLYHIAQSDEAKQAVKALFKGKDHFNLSKIEGIADQDIREMCKMIVAKLETLLQEDAQYVDAHLLAIKDLFTFVNSMNAYRRCLQPKESKQKLEGAKSTVREILDISDIEHLKKTSAGIVLSAKRLDLLLRIDIVLEWFPAKSDELKSLGNKAVEAQTQVDLDAVEDALLVTLGLPPKDRRAAE